jgi:hypothetical protein
MYDHGVYRSPPPQPSKDAQKHISLTDSGTTREALVAMHKRSEAASAAPKAQQHLSEERIEREEMRID